VTTARRSVLTLGPLVAVMFFTVSGGPFGLEGLVGDVGPGVAILLLVLTPLLYSVPETLIIGELASMLPVEGGYYQWVKRAFGRFAGFTNGWLSWMYSLIDMAIYPVLFLQYLQFFTGPLGRLPSWLLALALIWGATWLNLRGTRTVGLASGWFVGLVLAPFAVLAGAALELRRKNPPGSLVVCRVGRRNLELLRNLGLHRLLTVDAGDFPMDFGQNATALNPTPDRSELENARLVLEAHENLVIADPANQGKFQDVLAFLRNRMEEK